MKRIIFRDCEELGDYLINRAMDGYCASAVLFYEDAICLTQELMRYDGVVAESLNIDPVCYNTYDKEYYVSIDDDMTVIVEPAYFDGRYLDLDADIILIDGNANSAIIRNRPECKCREIYVGNSCNDIDEYEEEYGFDDIFENHIEIIDYDDDGVTFRIDTQTFFDYFFN